MAVVLTPIRASLSELSKALEESALPGSNGLENYEVRVDPDDTAHAELVSYWSGVDAYRDFEREHGSQIEVLDLASSKVLVRYH